MRCSASSPPHLLAPALHEVDGDVHGDGALNQRVDVVPRLARAGLAVLAACGSQQPACRLHSSGAQGCVAAAAPSARLRAQSHSCRARRARARRRTVHAVLVVVLVVRPAGAAGLVQRVVPGVPAAVGEVEAAHECHDAPRGRDAGGRGAAGVRLGAGDGRVQDDSLLVVREHVLARQALPAAAARAQQASRRGVAAAVGA